MRRTSSCWRAGGEDTPFASCSQSHPPPLWINVMPLSESPRNGHQPPQGTQGMQMLPCSLPLLAKQVPDLALDAVPLRSLAGAPKQHYATARKQD
jgi:hypothetical protein